MNFNLTAFLNSFWGVFIVGLVILIVSNIYSFLDMYKIQRAMRVTECYKKHIRKWGIIFGASIPVFIFTCLGVSRFWKSSIGTLAISILSVFLLSIFAMVREARERKALIKKLTDAHNERKY